MPTRTTFKKITEVEKRCKAIAQKYKNKNIKLIFGVTTGGIVPGFLVAKYMRKQHLYRNMRPDKSFNQLVYVNPKTNILIVDDIEDSGETKKRVKKIFPNGYFESVFKKRKDQKQIWLLMPWETNQDSPNERQSKKI